MCLGGSECVFKALHRHGLYIHFWGWGHVRPCRVPVSMPISSLKTPVYAHDLTCIGTQAWGENVPQPGLTLLECSLLDSSGPLALVLHSHSTLLTSQILHLRGACRPLPLSHLQPQPLCQGQPSQCLDDRGKVKHSVLVFCLLSLKVFSIKCTAYSHV